MCTVGPIQYGPPRSRRVRHQIHEYLRPLRRHRLRRLHVSQPRKIQEFSGAGFGAAAGGAPVVRPIRSGHREHLAVGLPWVGWGGVGWGGVGGVNGRGNELRQIFSEPVDDVVSPRLGGRLLGARRTVDRQEHSDEGGMNTRRGAELEPTGNRSRKKK